MNPFNHYRCNLITRQIYGCVITNENAWAFTHLPRRTFLKSFCPNDVTLWRHMRVWHQVVASQDVLTSHNRQWICIMPLKSEKSQWNCPDITFSHLMTLTYDLDHRTWPRYGPGWPTSKISCPYVKRFSRESADRRTHRQTDRRDRFYYLDRWRGR